MAITSTVDPYKNFLFRVKWDNRYVCGVSKVSGLKRTVEVVKYTEGGVPNTRLMPGQVESEAITLERGITDDEEFRNWANTVWGYANTQGEIGASAPVNLAEFRKTIIIEVYNLAGEKVQTYSVYNCWVSEFQTLPELDASSNEVAIEMLTIQNEGWELQAA